MNRIDFRLPALGADMESATLTQWLKKPGEPIRRGDAIAVVETTKGLIDIECFDTGVVEELLTQPGTTVPVGAVIAHIASEAPAATPAPSAAPAPAIAPAARPAPGATAAAAPARLRVSPAARHRASELGIDLAKVQGSGPDGLVRLEDIEQLAKAAPAPAPRVDMRAAIGAAMARSKREIPHYYLAHTMDFSTARDWLAQFNANRPVEERLLDAVLLVKAVALAAAANAGFNGYFRDSRFERSATVNVGTAIALRGGGLVAPALFDADHKDLPTLMREFSDLVTRVRTGHMRSSEVTSATITLTSLGAEAVDALYPIINPPQVAIVGAGAVAERPWVSDGKLAVRAVLTLTLAADHRVTDGRAGSRFLHQVADLLTQPEKL